VVSWVTACTIPARLPPVARRREAVGAVAFAKALGQPVFGLRLILRPLHGPEREIVVMLLRGSAKTTPGGARRCIT
jgi:hypothetical protein